MSTRDDPTRIVEPARSPARAAEDDDVTHHGPSDRPGVAIGRRLWILALSLALAAALVGAAAALGVARATGWGVEKTIHQIRAGTSSIDSRPADIQGILAKVLPSVVSVAATSRQITPFFGQWVGSTVVASGTGIVVSQNAEVVTNAHVVSGATSITVTLNGSSTPLPAVLVGAAPGNDLALLRINGAGGLTPVTFADSRTTLVGDSVLAVGYALGLAGGPTVTDGIVSGLNRSVTTETASGQTVTLTPMVQTDAAISSGNSGGPLVNSAGEVVGVNTVVATSNGSTTAQNIGFAIPSATVRALLPTLRTGGT